MRPLKTFEEYLREGIVSKTSKNKERSKSLVLESQRKMRSLTEWQNKIGIFDHNANDYVEYCYDSIMLLIRARLYLEGFAASGKGAHEGEVSYLRVMGFPESDVQFADSLRYFRNGILYYGTSLDKEYAEQVIAFTKRVQPKLKEALR